MILLLSPLERLSGNDLSAKLWRLLDTQFTYAAIAFINKIDSVLETDWTRKITF